MTTQIIAVSVVQNEDLFIAQVLKNIIPLCDRILVLDNNSTDNTVAVVSEIQKQYPQIEMFHLDDTRNVLDILQEYISSDTWVIAADGDELYDPHGMLTLREEILDGRYRDYWELRGYFFHVCKLDLDKQLAEGYMSPPAKEISKFYNLRMVKEWKPDGVTTLFHPTPIFRKLKLDPYKLQYEFYAKYLWEECPYRCLHMRFLQRSSIEKLFMPGHKATNPRFLGVRLNATDKYNQKVLGELSETGVIKNYRAKFRVGKKRQIVVESFFADNGGYS